MKRRRLFLATQAALLGALALVPAARAETRGELLYTTHCIACHSAQLHWRDQSVATDWESLKAQVRRWQQSAALQWTEADVVEVARYLNATIYHHPQPSDRVSRADPSSRP